MPDHRARQTQGHDQRDHQGPAGHRTRQAGDELDRLHRGRPYRMAAGGVVCRLCGAVLSAKLADGKRDATHRATAARGDRPEDQSPAAQIFRQGQLRRCAEPHYQRCGRDRADARPVAGLADYVGHAVLRCADHDVLQQRDPNVVRHRLRTARPDRDGRHHEGLATILRAPAGGPRRRERPC